MRHLLVPPKSRCAISPWASSRSVMVTFWPLMMTSRSPLRTRLQGTPQAASSRTALGAVLTNILHDVLVGAPVAAADGVLEVDVFIVPLALNDIGETRLHATLRRR